MRLFRRHPTPVTPFIPTQRQQVGLVTSSHDLTLRMHDRFSHLVQVRLVLDPDRLRVTVADQTVGIVARTRFASWLREPAGQLDFGRVSLMSGTFGYVGLLVDDVIPPSWLDERVLDHLRRAVL